MDLSPKTKRKNKVGREKRDGNEWRGKRERGNRKEGAGNGMGGAGVGLMIPKTLDFFYIF